MTTFGYARVSTQHQSLTRQIKNITETYPDAVIFEEKWTGTTTERPIFKRLLKVVQPGDCIVFDEISRMSRNAAEGYSIYKDLYERGVDLVFLKESALNTEVFRRTQQISLTGQEVADIFIEATNKVLWLLAEQQIIEAFKSAELEVELLHKRVREGMRSAKDKWEEEELQGKIHDKKRAGRQTGAVIETRKAKEAKRVIRQHSKDFNGSLSDPDCIKLAGCSRNSFYKFKRELRESEV